MSVAICRGQRSAIHPVPLSYAERIPTMARPCVNVLRICVAACLLLAGVAAPDAQAQSQPLFTLMTDRFSGLANSAIEVVDLTTMQTAASFSLGSRSVASLAVAP